MVDPNAAHDRMTFGQHISAVRARGTERLAAPRLDIIARQERCVPVAGGAGDDDQLGLKARLTGAAKEPSCVGRTVGYARLA